MGYGGFFRPAGQPRDDEFGIIAARVAEQIGSTRAASQSQQTKKATEVAERPQPTRAVTITENPDGTLTRTETIKNAPKKDPGQEVAEAGNEPYAAYFESVAGGLTEDAAELAAEQKASFDRLQNDPRWQTEAGRRELATKYGLTDPASEAGGFMRRGLFRYREDRRKYESLVSDPEQLRAAILASEFGKRQEFASSIRPFAADLAGEQTRKRLRDTEDRQQRNADRQERRDLLRDLDQRDVSHFGTADDVVKWLQQGYAPEEWDAVKDYIEPAARLKYAEDTRAAQERKIRLQIAENDAKIRDAKSDEQADHLRLSNERLRQLIDRGEKASEPKPTKSFRGWSTIDFAEAVNDETVDQAALRRSGNSRLERLNSQIVANNGRIRVLEAEVAALAKDPNLKNDAKKAADLAGKQARLQNYVLDNERLSGEKRQLFDAGYGSNAQPRILTKEEAAAKLRK